MIIFLKILFIILSYLIGSIPFGLIISKIKKQDIRKKGSCNIGAANAGRVLGKGYAALTFVLDMFKGALFVILFRYKIIPSSYMVLSPSLYGFLACLGHCYPIYLKFKGGKGVATGAGCIFAYFPLLSIVALSIFFIVVKISKIAALGSLISGFVLSVVSIILSIIGYDFILKLDVDIYMSIMISLIYIIIVIKHIPNIKRIINRNENTVDRIKD